jgi:hypothetical protein
MVNRVLFGSILAATAMTVAHAGPDDTSTGAPPFPKVVYALPPAPFVVPPTGYVLNPSDAARPFYVVNQGPVGFGIVPYARPTYSEGGYAFADAYPYAYPYIQSYGYGTRYGYRAFRPPAPAYYGDVFARPYGAPPYTAYRYRTAPSAKIIHVPQDD